MFFSACNGFEKVRKSNDVNYKLTKANEYYDKKDYAHANMLYKELMPIMKSTRNYEFLMYRYAFTYYYMKDYMFASYYFKNFTDQFPAAKEADECEYLAAECLFKNAPKYSLDQANTSKSLEALQSYVNRHPDSKHTQEANKLIAEAQRKLELKQADAAKLYFNISQYKAASVAYKSVMRNFPESPDGDLYTYMIMKSQYRYAKGSIPSKQEERFANAVATYRDFKNTYPQSKFTAEADKISKDAENNLNKIRNEHQ